MSGLSILSKQIRLNDGLYCLNDLHKAAGYKAKHRPNQFLRTEQTKALIEEIEGCADMRTPVLTKHGLGTFVSKEVVYAYAMWISPKFHLLVIHAFDHVQQKPKQMPRANPLDYQRILMVIEDGQVTDTQHLDPQKFVTSYDLLPEQLRYAFDIKTSQLLSISNAVNQKLTQLIEYS